MTQNNGLIIDNYLIQSKKIMKELIEKLQNEHGLNPQQSYGILNTVKDFIKEKFPMMAGAVDNLFPADNTSGNTGVGDKGNTEGPAQKGGSFLDKISDTVPAESGENAEQFTKDKLGGFFSNDKKDQ